MVIYVNNLKKTFSLPRDIHKFNQIMRPIEGCAIVDSKMSEDIEGPKIIEVYKCPCGKIVLKQKSIVSYVDNPEKGSIEIVHMESKECTL